MPRNKTVKTNLDRATRTFVARGKVYGDSYNRHGAVMAAIYPKGLTLRSNAEFAKFGVINMMVSKVCRYTAHGNKGHADSAHDLIVYGAILEELTT